jgi:hypothetical protein
MTHTLYLVSYDKVVGKWEEDWLMHSVIASLSEVGANIAIAAEMHVEIRISVIPVLFIAPPTLFLCISRMVSLGDFAKYSVRSIKYTPQAHVCYVCTCCIICICMHRICLGLENRKS